MGSAQGQVSLSYASKTYLFFICMLQDREKRPTMLEDISRELVPRDENVPPVDKFLQSEVGLVPNTTTGWFRAGVAFYNKSEFFYCLQCLSKAEELDKTNFNVYQLSARVYIKLGRSDLAIDALKRSIKLNNISDWQLLIELTSMDHEQFMATKALAGCQNIHPLVQALLDEKEQQLRQNR